MTKKLLNTQLTSIFLPLTLIILYFLLSLGAFVYPGVVKNYAQFDARLLIIIAPVLVYLSNRYFGSQKNLFWIAHQYLSIIFLGISIGLVLAEFQTYTNFVFATYSIHFSRFFYLALTMVLVSLANKEKNFYKKNWRSLIFVLLIILIPVSMIISLRDPDIFRWMVAEDSLIEWLQFVLLLVCSYCSWSLATILKKRNRMFLAVCFYLAAVMCLFVGGEAISWGQRIFNVETPEQWAEHNMQNELTLHNASILFGYVYVGYMLIGFFGSISWIVRKIISPFISSKISYVLSFLIPDWHLLLYFLVAFVYSFNRVFVHRPYKEKLWEEPMELLLILGITFFFVQRFIVEKKKESKRIFK